MTSNQMQIYVCLFLQAEHFHYVCRCLFPPAGGSLTAEMSSHINYILKKTHKKTKSSCNQSITNI